MRPATAISLFALALASPPALSQHLVYQLGDTATSGDDYGRSVADAGDVDGDGTPDVIVGAPFDSPGGFNTGAVFTYSGRTGQLIWARVGEWPGDAFGWSVDGVGDLDGDGHGEVIVGAPLWDNNGTWDANGGKAYVINGATGGFMTTFAFNSLNARLGHVVRGLGDITGDGVGDFAYSIPYRDTGGATDNGYIAFYSGAGTNFLFSKEGTVDHQFLGFSLDVVRATGSQATSRLIVGCPGVNGLGIDRGLVMLLDGFGNTVSLFGGTTDNEWLGAAVAGIGDANGDGVEDYAMAAPYADILGVGADAGLVRVYSGAGTSWMYSVTGATAGANLGLSLAGLGDFDGNGTDDFLAGAPNDDTSVNDGGEARVVSGASGLTLANWYGAVNDHMGRAVSSAGDLNGDGVEDVIVGANDAPVGEGQAYVYLSRLDAPVTYCYPKVNSQGCVPEVSWEGTASLTIADGLHVRAENVLSNKNGILFWGLGQNDFPFMGGTLCVQGPLKRTPPQNSGGNAGTDCSGTYAFHFSQAYMTAQGLQPGDRVHAQFWSRDPGASFQVGLTDAAAFDVAP